MRMKLFLITFILGMSLFAAANIYDFSHSAPPCCDLGGQFGIPFPLGTTGGYAGGTHLHAKGLLLDGLIAAAVSALLAFFVEKLARVNVFVRAARRARRQVRRGLKNYLDAAR